MKIEIKNCNNIANGCIYIENKKLNIKFWTNWTGKSTIAKAIQYKIEKEEYLTKLLPFNLRKENPDNLESIVEIDEEVKSILVFNEEYVKQFLFKQDTLINNSFEIFIKDSKYVETEKNIEKQLKEIKKIFIDNEELEQTILDFENLSKSFKTTKKWLSDASAISKGLKDWNKLENIPEELKEYKPFLQDQDKCVNWLDWQIKGNIFIDGHDNCPYCVSSTDQTKKDKIKLISENYDKTVIKNFIEIIKILENLWDYFSPNSKDKLLEITKKKDWLLDEEKTYITTIKSQIDDFLKRLKDLNNIWFNNLKDDEQIEEKLKWFIIKIDELFDKLNSEKTISIVDNLNESLRNTLDEIGKLKGQINTQKKQIEKSIKKNEISINQFLINAGYKYKVLIDDEHKIRLQHIDFESEISGGDQHLSFGERNAFALVLFMYEALSKNIDLIILDDPISSFDKNKKYAILQMLFREKKSFKSKTVLMLTHDIEPVIDSTKALADKFKDQTNSSFIKSSKGILTEIEIKKENILTFPQICKQIIKDDKINVISKLIYLRRNFEILNNKWDEYQILSDLFHKRTKEEAKINRQERIDDLTDANFEENFTNGESEIKKIILDFDYENILKTIHDTAELKKIYNILENWYEKLQIFRIINWKFTKDDDFSDVMKKFINETYHIENDFIHQLNPREYDLIPEFIVKECDNFIVTL